MDIYIKGMTWTFAAPLWVCTLCLQFLNHSGKHSFWSLKLWRVRFVELWNQLTRMVFHNGLLPRDCTFKLINKRHEVLLSFLLCPLPFESSCKEMGGHNHISTQTHKLDLSIKEDILNNPSLLDISVCTSVCTINSGYWWTDGGNTLQSIEYFRSAWCRNQ